MPEILKISVDQKIQEENDRIAERIRNNLTIPMIDIMGSVGSGKTSILITLTLGSAY